MEDQKLTKLDINNFIVKISKMMKDAKRMCIQKLNHQASILEKKKVKSEKEREKNSRKAEKYLEQINVLKTLSSKDISKCVLLYTKPLSLLNDPEVSIEEKVICRIAHVKPIEKTVELFRAKYPTWQEESSFIIKSLGANYRAERKKKYEKKGKLNEFIQEEYKSLVLLNKVIGFDFDPKMLESNKPAVNLNERTKLDENAKKKRKSKKSDLKSKKSHLKSKNSDLKIKKSDLKNENFGFEEKIENFSSIYDNIGLIEENNENPGLIDENFGFMGENNENPGLIDENFGFMDENNENPSLIDENTENHGLIDENSGFLDENTENLGLIDENFGVINKNYETLLKTSKTLKDANVIKICNKSKTSEIKRIDLSASYESNYDDCILESNLKRKLKDSSDSEVEDFFVYPKVSESEISRLEENVKEIKNPNENKKKFNNDYMSTKLNQINLNGNFRSKNHIKSTKFSKNSQDKIEFKSNEKFSKEKRNTENVKSSSKGLKRSSVDRKTSFNSMKRNSNSLKKKTWPKPDSKKVKNVNLVPVAERKITSNNKKDAAIHPSWQAKKSQNASISAVKFQGKKVVFDD